MVTAGEQRAPPQDATIDLSRYTVSPGLITATRI